MADQTYSIKFEGYLREPDKNGIPEESGIYCVYTCTHNKQEKTVSINDLVYIGESEDVRSRIANHEKQKDWESHLKNGELLCYSFGGISSVSRVRCEAALIFKHKPLENTEYVNSFPFDQTIMKLSDKTVKLTTNFTVNRK